MERYEFFMMKKQVIKMWKSPPITEHKMLNNVFPDTIFDDNHVDRFQSRMMHLSFMGIWKMLIINYTLVVSSKFSATVRLFYIKCFNKVIDICWRYSLIFWDSKYLMGRRSCSNHFILWKIACIIAWKL